MAALAYPKLISVPEYLSGEELSGVKHEYIGGEVFAMAGASKTHNRLAGRAYTLLESHLSGSPCEPFVGDMKVNLRLGTHEVFYYPDVVVACDPRDTDSHFIRFPKLIIEILSASTDRADRVHKFRDYRTIPTLEEYVLISQYEVKAIIYRRRSDWQGEMMTELTDPLPLESVALTITLGQLYENIRLEPFDH
jgi:Uma2 family endonuclease